jgi:hypothetical protein
MLFPDIQRLRNVVRLLRGRANLHLGVGGTIRHGANCGRFGVGDPCFVIPAADRGDGYLLMSFGSNGIDDGGDGQDGWINDVEWQTEPYLGDRHTDHVIRVPVPRRSPAESGGDASAAPADVVD